MIDKDLFGKDVPPIEEVNAEKDLTGRNKVIGLRSISEGVNPKDKIGASKVDLTVCSPVAMAWWAFAQMDGVTKYGAYNWRVEPIQMRTYLSAGMRHLLDVLDGEDIAPDSLAMHLGHVMATCAIILDAQHYGTLVDDRPVQHPGKRGVSALFDRLNEAIKTVKPDGWGR